MYVYFSLAWFEETGFDPRRLEIELTETAIMSDFAMAQSTLRQLHALGVPGHAL